MNSRLRFIEDQGMLVIHIENRRKWGVLVFFGLCVLGWAGASLLALFNLAAGQPAGQFASTPGTFVAWLVFGLTCCYLFLVMAFGREIIRLDGKDLFWGIKVLGRERGSRIKKEDVVSLSAQEYQGLRLSLDYSLYNWGVAGGNVILAGPGKKTYRFGRVLAKEEAEFLVRRLKDHLPHLQSGEN